MSSGGKRYARQVTTALVEAKKAMEYSSEVAVVVYLTVVQFSHCIQISVVRKFKNYFYTFIVFKLTDFKWLLLTDGTMSKSLTT